jgi:hypothetical protein
MAMQQKRFVKMVLLVPVWAYAAATWALIGHQLVGLPDLTVVAALAAGIAAAAWMLRGGSTSTSQSTQAANPPSAITPASRS